MVWSCFFFVLRCFYFWWFSVFGRLVVRCFIDGYVSAVVRLMLCKSRVFLFGGGMLRYLDVFCFSVVWVFAVRLIGGLCAFGCLWRHLLVRRWGVT